VTKFFRKQFKDGIILLMVSVYHDEEGMEKQRKSSHAR
jgi:hypothetical protein